MLNGRFALREVEQELQKLAEERNLLRKERDEAAATASTLQQEVNSLHSENVRSVQHFEWTYAEEENLTGVGPIAAGEGNASICNQKSRECSRIQVP
jgi:hypothetical protein